MSVPSSGVGRDGPGGEISPFLTIAAGGVDFFDDFFFFRMTLVMRSVGSVVRTTGTDTVSGFDVCEAGG